MLAPKPPRSRRRVALIAGSFVAHGAVAVSMFVSGVWDISRLDPGRRTVSLAVLEPPAAQGSPPAREAPKLDPKVVPTKQVAKVLVQIEKIDKPDPTPHPDSTIAGGNGLGSGSGDGDNPDGTDVGGGHCVGPACAPPEPTPHVALPDPPKPPPPPTTIAPPMMAGLRYAGETNVTPPDSVKQEMLRDDHKRSVGAFRVCLAADGSIASVGMVASTKYPAYDAALRRAIDSWRYHPYQVDGRGVPACGMVTFVYTIQ